MRKSKQLDRFMNELNHEKEFETCMRDLEEVKIEEVDKRIICVVVLK